MEDQGHDCNELQKLRKLVAKLAMEIDAKNMRLFYMEEKYDQLSTALKSMAMDKRKLQQDHARGITCCTIFGRLSITNGYAVMFKFPHLTLFAN